MMSGDDQMSAESKTSNGVAVELAKGRRYTLDELLAKCDPTAPAPEIDRLPHLVVMIDRWEGFTGSFAEIATITPINCPPSGPSAPSITSTPTALLAFSASKPRPYQMAPTKVT